MEREQGDINTTPSREKWWKRNLSERGRKILDDDNRYFLRQSLSTPVMNAIGKAYSIYIEDIEGKRYIDMHGNGVHNAGFNNPEVNFFFTQNVFHTLTFSIIIWKIQSVERKDRIFLWGMRLRCYEKIIQNI